MYDTFGADYDRFVNWEGRLALELPFLEGQLRGVQARRVLDAACGTGMHTVALAQRGYDVVGADLSRKMVARARENASRAGVVARFLVAGFGRLAGRVGEPFDALLCLGNSLPHVLSRRALHEALADFAVCLRPGGLLLLQNLNYDRILAHQPRWLPLQAHREGEGEWLFLRHYDYEPDGLITFHVLTLKREDAGWSQQAMSAPLRPLPQGRLAAALEEAGFGDLAWRGDMQGAPFRADESPNLVAMATTPLHRGDNP